MMALPSSPPLPFEDPPSSPPLLPTLSDISFTANAGRKRLHSDYGSLSSDPLFSEDTSEFAFHEDEEQPKRKRMVKGPWWNMARRSRHDLRRSMIKKDGFRNVDSGVWMGSDDSLESFGSERSRHEHLAREEVVKQRSRIDATEDDPEGFAARVVQGCVDNGKEMIDLSGIGLTSISSAALLPLHQMIRHAHDDLTQPPSEDQYSCFTPSIQLFLYGNLLSSLPAELFKLRNITVLSLRNNSLEELPAAITQLNRLTELNVAGNRLNHLPWSVLDLLRSTEDVCKVSLRPNPFRVPKVTIDKDSSKLMQLDEQLGDDQHPVASAMSKSLEARFLRGRQTLNGGDEDATPKKKRNSREQLIFLAPSRIRFLDSEGSVVRPSMTAHPSGEIDWEAPVLEPQSPPVTQASTTAPSLFELVLRSAQESYDLRDVTALLPLDTPSTVSRALEQAARGVEYGNDQCSTCSKPFVMPRAEWLEYWFHGHDYYDLTQDAILPFKRTACSWACAQVTSVGTAFC